MKRAHRTIRQPSWPVVILAAGLATLVGRWLLSWLGAGLFTLAALLGPLGFAALVWFWRPHLSPAHQPGAAI